MNARAKFGRDVDPDRAPAIDYVVEFVDLDPDDLECLLRCLGASPQLQSVEADLPSTGTKADS